MKKYIPYVLMAVFISVLISILSYVFSDKTVSAISMLVISSIGTVMVSIIICLIGRILEDKNTLLIKTEEKGE